ncbi:SNF2 superfamily protein [Gymnopilus junonius]|uniref:SNF2 superfamily protein n=1 Tax=Gymnopilus junonius TaxID=109634 RepID=A0A9P5TM61_GYMJU|nr:SNF2 superfamily protein [Gymnopilus junonius]
MNTNVVGIQYYRVGMVGPGEEVLLVREPQNPYDRNAIQVKNIGRVQVGHLPRNVAGKLAPLLDRRAVTVEGVINDVGGSRAYTLSITLKIFGPSDKRRELEPALIWATPHQRGFPSSSTRPSATAAQQEAVRKQQEAIQKAAELKQILNGLEKVDDEGRRGSLLDTLCLNEDILNMPLYPNPPSIATGELKVDLLKHQLQALQWCIERENPILPTKETDRPVQFWQVRTRGNQKYYYNRNCHKNPQEVPPPLGKGALCADAMGKTLTMLALILATKKDVDPGFSRSTLIVVPLSILSNWEKQIADHCTRGVLSSCIYYGSGRGLSAAELQKYDVVITTYQTVSGEHGEGSNSGSGSSKKKQKGEKNLFEVPWKRIILDEGHTIRNPKTKMAKGVVALNASRHWVLTGTPIINSPRDLGSILTFLKICRPLDNEDFFKRLLLRPLKNGEPSGAELLKVLMSHICIRRTKEMQDSQGKSIIELPPVEWIKVPVALNNDARCLYDEVEELSKQRVQTALAGQSAAVVQSNILSMLTRMRQIALHPGLVPVNYLEQLRSTDANIGSASKAIALTPEEKFALQGRLAQAVEDCEECPICFQVLSNESRITTCAHPFCLACITEILSRDPKCPLDRRILTTADLIEPPPPTDLTQKPFRFEESESIRGGSSAKIEQLIHLLKLTPATEKSLVFSQFTSFIDKVAEALEEAGIPFVRFDGQMSAKRRQEAIACFSVKGKGKARGHDEVSFEVSEENPRVMLLSLKAGALGLNLTGAMANNVYLWWQEGIESQAVDRVNRIGQKKNVHVYQLIAEDTVESRVLEIQEKKKQLIQQVHCALPFPWSSPFLTFHFFQAFSGTKRTETQRQQREARLQGDLYYLLPAIYDELNHLF